MESSEDLRKSSAKFKRITGYALIVLSILQFTSYLIACILDGKFTYNFIITTFSAVAFLVTGIIMIRKSKE